MRKLPESRRAEPARPECVLVLFCCCYCLNPEREREGCYEIYSLMVGLQTGCLPFELRVFSSEGMLSLLLLFLKNLGMGCGGTELQQLITTNYLESILFVIKYTRVFCCVTWVVLFLVLSDTWRQLLCGRRLCPGH